MAGFFIANLLSPGLPVVAEPYQVKIRFLGFTPRGSPLLEKGRKKVFLCEFQSGSPHLEDPKMAKKGGYLGGVGSQGDMGLLGG